MSSTLTNVIMFVISLALIIILLMQARGDSSQLFGPAESTFRSRRGLEQLLFRATIVLGGLFVVVAILNVRFGG